MNDRSAGLWVVLLVALAGVMHVAPIGSQSGGPVGKPAQPASIALPPNLENAQQGVITALEQFYAVDPENDEGCRTYFDLTEKTPSEAQKKPQCEALDRFWGPDETQNSGSMALIALVPDPVDAHAAYRFDETLESLQTGVQEAGYLLDRFSLAWPRSGSSPSTDKEDDKAGAEGFRTMPSLLVFRSSTDPNKVLLVFLVGETPTAGIHKTAMLQALRMSRVLLRRYPQSGETSRLRVIGPNFSGSMVSIRHAVEQWCPEVLEKNKVTLHFISANSTSLGARTSLKETKCANAELQFHGTVLDDDLLEKALYSYLNGIGVSRQNIAVLIESDSSYGRAFIKSDDQASGKPSGFAYVLPYPMQISQVRTSELKDSDVDGEAISVMENPAHAVLHLALDDAVNPLDKPPVYSAGPIANLAELSLSNIIHTLNRENIHYVGLFGTDTRDKLFLARLIRSYHPNIQFFTNDSEILFAHPSYTADLWGMIIASTYPLVPQSQTWLHNSTHPQIIRQFSSQSAASVHNAASIAVGRETLDNQTAIHPEYLMVQGTDKYEGMVDYNDPFLPDQKLPVAWITIVGNESLWPVSLYDPWVDHDAKSIVSGALNIERSRSFSMLFLVLTLFCMVNCYQYLYTSRQWERVKPKPEDILKRQYRMFEPAFSDSEKQDNWQRRGIFFFFLLLLVFYTAITTLVLIPPPSTLGSVELIVALAAMGVLAFTVLESIRSMLPDGWKNSAAAFWIQGLGAIAVVVTLAVWSRSAARAENILLYERATHLGSGISPILPVLFLSFGLGAGLVCFLRRMQLSIFLDNLNPYSRKEGDPFSRLYANISKAMNPVYSPVSRAVAITLAVLSAATIAWTAWGNFFVTIEGKYFDWGLFGAFAILVAGLFWAAFHFVAIWYHLRRLLQQLSCQHLSAAFVRLPQRMSRGLSTNLLDSPPTLLELGEPVDTLAAIRSQFAQVKRSDLSDEQDKCLPDTLDTTVKAIDDSLKLERSEALDRKKPLQALSSDTQKMLCEASGKLFEALWSYWERNPFHDRPKPERDAIAKGFKLSENFVASQTVAHFNYVFMTLRYLFACTGSSVVFLLLATSSYPFRTQNLMMNFAWILLLLFAALHLVMFLQMDQSEVLRAVANQQNKSTLNRAVVSQAIVFGVIPVLMFLGSKFPTLGRVLFAWVSPALKAIKFQ